jgi:hypothetical protein
MQSSFPKGNIMTTKIMKKKLPLSMAAIRNPMGFRPGLTIALVDSDVVSEIAREVLTHLVMAGNAQLGIKFAKPKVVRTWHPGSEHQQEHLKAANNYYLDPLCGTKRIVHCIEAERGFNWLSDAGWMAVSETIAGNDKSSAQGDWNILIQNGAAFQNCGVIRTLLNLDQAAKTAGNHVMVIIWGKSKGVGIASILFGVCEKVITVKACEADPGTHYAITIGTSSMHDDRPFSKGAVMASLVRTQDKYKINIEPFTCTKLAERLDLRRHRSRFGQLFS